MQKQDVLSRITLKYYHLTKTEKTVADYIIDKKNNVQFMSINELSDACDVADSTITRFCRKINCDGFNGFKLELASISSNRALEQENSLSVNKDGKSNFLHEVKNSHIDTINESMSLIKEDALNKAVDLIENAGTILCVGQGASMIMAQEAAHLFSTVRNNVVAMLDSHIQASFACNLNENDIVLSFSYSGSTRELLELIEINKKNNVKTVLITRYPRSPGALKADVVLLCGSIEPPQRMGSVSARIAQLFVLDLLFAEYNRRNPEKCEEFKRKILKSITKKLL